ncbi:MAG TPA: protein phosphatase 2C domain-containing protein [Anaerolineaceae bacterium]
MIRVEKSHLPFAAMTNAGMSGKNNEDYFGVAAFQLDAEKPLPVMLMVLSDGIGGHRGGEHASNIAVNHIIQRVAESDASTPVETMKEAIQSASAKIYEEAQADREKRGMGATVSVAWIIGKRLYTATVGDSRIYLLRNHTAQQVSTDHTWIQDMLDAGILKPDQVEGHPNAHVIRRYLGSPTPPEVDFRLRLNNDETNEQALANQGTTLQPGDYVLLCSDGLTDLVKNDEILAAFEAQEIEPAVSFLIDLANQRGGHDNITIIVAKLPAPKPTHPVEKTAPLKLKKELISRKWLVFGCGGIIALAVLISAVVMGTIWIIRGEPTSTITPTMAITPTLGITQPSSGQATIAPSAFPVPSITSTTQKSSPTIQPTPKPPTPTLTYPPVPTQTLTQTSIPPTSGPTITPFPTDTVMPKPPSTAVTPTK